MMNEIKRKGGHMYESCFKTRFVIGIICLIIGFACGWFVCRENVHVDRIRNESVNEQFEQLREYQSTTIDSLESIGNGLDDSINRVNEIEESVSAVAERNGTSKELINRSTEIIGELKSILGRIGAREENN